MQCPLEGGGEAEAGEVEAGAVVVVEEAEAVQLVEESICLLLQLNVVKDVLPVTLIAIRGFLKE